MGCAAQGSDETWRPSPRVAAWTGMGAFALVLLLGAGILVFGNGPLPIDAWWHDLMRAARTDTGLVIARSLAFIGSLVPMIVIGVSIVTAYLIARRPWSALAVAATMIVADAFTGLVKTSFSRGRPLDSLAETGLLSFPSGHTTLAASVAVMLALLAGRGFAWVLASGWILLMGWSRTYLEAHWLTDTIGGALLGASVALAVWSVLGEFKLLRAQRAFIPL